MYILWLVIRDFSEEKKVIEERILGFFPPSNFWTSSWKKAKALYFEENIRYEFVRDLSDLTPYLSKLISA